MRRYLATCLLGSCFLAPAASFAQGGPAAAPAGLEFAVVRAYFQDRAQVERLARERSPWRVDYRKGYLVIDVDAAGYQRLIELGFRVEVDAELTRRYRSPPQRLPGQTSGIPGFPCYRTVEETHASAQALAAAHPQLATWTDVGDSWEKSAGTGGYDLMVLRLTNNALPGPKPKFFAMSAIHAREYTTAELMTRFAEHLIERYGIDADVTWLLDAQEVHLLLQSNPDGRKQAETGALWRKNTNRNYCGPTSSSRGADLNRNYPYEWGCCGGSSGSQCSETYRGVSPASEPETQAVRDYVRSIFPDQRDDTPAAPADATGVFLDVHSYSQLVLWPWGYTPADAPNGAALQTLGRKLAWFNGYLPEQAFDLYVTDGTTDDFAYGELGLAAYTFELGTDFFENCGSFESRILPDNLEALIWAAKAARAPYLAPAGPDTVGVALSANVVAPGEIVTLNATLDDTRYSSANGVEPRQNVAAGEYYVDVPPWSTELTPQPIALAPADGAFNGTVEDVTGEVATAALAQGRHTLYLRGRDAAGNAGLVSAAFLHVVDPATAPRITGSVTAAGSGEPIAATVSANAQFSTQSDAATGDYTLLLVPGTYDVTATSAGGDYAPATAAGLQADELAVLEQDFRLYPYCDLFADDVESGNAGWTAQLPWAITTEASASPTHSWTDSADRDYGNNRNVSLTSPALDLSGYFGAQLRFNHVCDTEAGYDYCLVEAAPDGVTWQTVASFDGASAGWQPVVIDLPQLGGAGNARIRFRLSTDPSVTADGWHVDDVRVRGAGAACITSDADADGVTDGFDNCTLVVNPDQRDSNGDGYGNACDADLSNDGTINFSDLALLKEVIFSSGDLDADFDGNGQVDFVDLGIMKNSFFGAPGPSGVASGP
jgi:hypothetical protein